MSDVGDRLEVFKALVDDAFVDNPLKVRQEKAAIILSSARNLLSEEEFKELESYILRKLEK